MKPPKKPMKPQFTPFLTKHKKSHYQLNLWHTKKTHEIPLFSPLQAFPALTHCILPAAVVPWMIVGAVLERSGEDSSGFWMLLGSIWWASQLFLWTWKMVRVQSFSSPIAARNRRSSPRFNVFLVLDFHRPKSWSQSYSYLNLVLGSESCWGLIKLESLRSFDAKIW